ncbi:MAG: hypothetical protein RLP12_14825 [Ekhidna sp.]
MRRWLALGSKKQNSEIRGAQQEVRLVWGIPFETSKVFKTLEVWVIKDDPPYLSNHVVLWVNRLRQPDYLEKEIFWLRTFAPPGKDIF